MNNMNSMNNMNNNLNMESKMESKMESFCMVIQATYMTHVNAHSIDKTDSTISVINPCLSVMIENKLLQIHFEDGTRKIWKK